MIVPVQAAGATSNIHIVKYAEDGVTILEEKTVSYEWMQQMLPVQGDGKTHYYHQGPIFEGDMWDPQEINNLKDKGAVKGTAVKDLCDLIGGMSPGDEIMFVSVDGWHCEFAYNSIYQPLDIQGDIILSWYNGEDSQEGESYGVGYPGNNAYHSSIQMVFMTEVPNSEGKFVFGNSDMKLALPQEKYQHFYDGQFPSTNGLSGKWIAEVRIYSNGIPSGLKIDYTTANYPPSHSDSDTLAGPSFPFMPIALGVIGILLVAAGIFLLSRFHRFNFKTGSVFLAAIILIVVAVVFGVRSQQDPIENTWKLTLTGADGQQKVLSMKDIRSLPSYTGSGGFFSTVGVVYGPYKAKGVLLSDICQLVGGITPSDIVMISASDGYSTVFDYDQVMGELITYDTRTLKETPHGELKAILMYQQDGKRVPQNDGKPLRIAIVGTDGLLTEGNNWVKWVNQIEVLKIQKAAR
ncbi:MAG: molybdopterin-dependent oxidoreductase [Dehalococcoidales bacterium]|nr:molybdopterin-dependent oxidoreductase [Dehalococcoidales bacterium]